MLWWNESRFNSRKRWWRQYLAQTKDALSAVGKRPFEQKQAGAFDRISPTPGSRDTLTQIASHCSHVCIRRSHHLHSEQNSAKVPCRNSSVHPRRAATRFSGPWLHRDAPSRCSGRVLTPSVCVVALINRRRCRWSCTAQTSPIRPKTGISTTAGPLHFLKNFSARCD